MNETPLALRLADVLDTTPDVQMRAREAAKELRRLQSEIKEWEKVCNQHLRHIKKLKKQIESTK